MVKRGCGCRYGRPWRGRQRSASTFRSCGPAAEAPRGAPRDLVTNYVPITCARQDFKPTYFTKSTSRFWAWLAIFHLHLGKRPPLRPPAPKTPHETFICVVLIGHRPVRREGGLDRSQPLPAPRTSATLSDQRGRFGGASSPDSRFPTSADHRPQRYPNRFDLKPLRRVVSRRVGQMNVSSSPAPGEMRAPPTRAARKRTRQAAG
jgi:hypothetical protein